MIEEEKNENDVLNEVEGGHNIQQVQLLPLPVGVFRDIVQGKKSKSVECFFQNKEIEEKKIEDGM